jgi:hypothetical protein
MPTRPGERLHQCDSWGGAATAVILGPADGHLDTSGLRGALLEWTTLNRPSEQVIILALVRTELRNKSL